MGVLTKNIPKVEQDLSNVPEGLVIRRKNAIAAGYNFAFDDAEKEYISYNKLREEKKSDEVLKVVKIYRLKDRDNGDEKLVWFQESKTYDYDDNLIPCPIVEKIGVEDAPQTTKKKNSANQIIDIDLIETKNDFYVDYSAEKLKELFERSRDSQEIRCYVGYTKPVKQLATDFMTDKKQIKDQIKFIDGDFDDLINTTTKDNIVKSYEKQAAKGKEKEKEKIPKEVEIPKKTLKEIQNEKEKEKEEENRIGQVEGEGEDDLKTKKGRLKVGSLD